MKWAKRITVAVLLLLALVGGIGIWIAQSDWLREKIRTSIIEQAERATGGRVELGAFRLDWRTLTVRLDNFVIHGSEPSAQAPLLAIDHVTGKVRIISVLQRDIGIDSIDVDHPRAHVIIDAAGNTNLPRPKLRQPVKSAVQTILDLKIAKFDLRDGAIVEESPDQPPRMFPANAHGEMLMARVAWNAIETRYSGEISLTRLHLGWSSLGPIDVGITAKGSMERNRITLQTAKLTSASSEIDLKDARLDNFAAPVITAEYAGHLSLDEAWKVLKLRMRQSGTVELAGNARFVSPADYRVTGSLRASGDVPGSAKLDAAPEKISLTDVRAGYLGGQITGRVEIENFDRFNASGKLERFDLRRTAALATKQPLPYNAVISGPFAVRGRLRDISARRVAADAHLDVAPATSGDAVRGSIAVRYDPATAKIDLGQSWLELPHTRVDLSGRLGEHLDVKLDSTDFGDLLPALDAVTSGKKIPLTFGSATFRGTVSGPLENPRIAGHAASNHLVYAGQQFDSVAGDVIFSETDLTVRSGTVVYNGMHAGGSGSVGLANWLASPASSVSASVAINKADLTRILTLAGHKEVDMSGSLDAGGQITGTLGDPRGTGEVALTKGFIYAQPYDSITGRVQLAGLNAQSFTGLFVSGPKRVNIIARFEHAGTHFPAGRLEFNLTSNTMPLNQIALVRARQPDIGGFGKFHVDGTLQISHDAQHQIQFGVLGLNADASANGLELEGRNLGDARFVAQSKGDVMTARFDSDAARASIHGEGTMGLSGDNPVNAKVTFSSAELNALVALMLKQEDAKDLKIDGVASGDLMITGPARKPDMLIASVNIPRLELKPLPGTDLARDIPNFTLTNNGPIRGALTKSMFRIESARFTGPQTDVSVAGTAAFTSQNPLDIRLQGSINVGLASTLNPDLIASGSIALNGTVRGAWESPELTGRASIRNADFHYSDFSNGLTGASGEIIFSGSRATIESFHGESGGGKVDLSGFAAYTNGMLAFRIETKTQGVRVRYPQGVSSISDSTITFAGTSQRSEASGVVTVHRVAVNPKTDAATILENTVTPVKTPAVKTGLVANMNLDIQIETAPDVALQTSVTQSIQADANLRLRGTATNPALLGRINITQGELIFFGNKYSINQGSVSFFNPARIDPILNIDLETKARGVDVILTVSGPVNKLNVNYRSDPPLQFSDIVALLATGRTPSDPTLAVRDTGQSQNFQQLGASALIGQALANPVAGRLQRFFGVSRLKIDPQLTGITGSPEARLTIEQQVTPEILFTYITDVSSTSTQLIRVEWSLNRRWSAILIREENGYVGLDFAFKKRFK